MKTRKCKRSLFIVSILVTFFILCGGITPSNALSVEYRDSESISMHSLSHKPEIKQLLKKELTRVRRNCRPGKNSNCD